MVEKIITVDDAKIQETNVAAETRATVDPRVANLGSSVQPGRSAATINPDMTIAPTSLAQVVEKLWNAFRSHISKDELVPWEDVVRELDANGDFSNREGTYPYRPTNT